MRRQCILTCLRLRLLLMPATLIVLTPCLILSLQRQYHSCHIIVPDSDERLPAIAIHNHYYSLFQVIPSPEQTIDIVSRLGQRGEIAAIRQLPVGGYAIWVHEPAATPTRSPSLIDRRSTRQPKPALCYVLTSRDLYQSVEIQVPDLDKSLSAIKLQNQYHSLFKKKTSAAQALEITAKLARRGDESVILALPDSTPHYSLYVLEPEASPT